MTVPPGDVHEMANAMVALARQPDERDRLGAAARRSAERDHDVRLVARRYEALFEQALRVEPRGH
jgi:glycosyltransferase involved in cell wall biosynthesis